MRRNIFALLLTVAVLALIAWAVDKYVQPILPSAFTSPAVFFIGSAIAIVSILGSLGSALDLVKNVLNVIHRRPWVNGTQGVSNGRPTPGGQDVTSSSRRSPASSVLSSPPVDFIGRDDDKSKLLEALRNSQIPLITLKGMGGIGKTALAKEAAKIMDDEQFFLRTVWISTQAERWDGEGVTRKEITTYSLDSLLADILVQSGMSSSAGAPTAIKLDTVREILSANPILIVLDNLETVTDRDALVASLFEILGQGKVLVTSRYAITHPKAFTIDIGGLSLADGIKFLKATASSQNNQNLIAASQATLARIHSVTGGAPLAMLLVSGQMYYRPVDRILQVIEKAGKSKLSYDFYGFIFKKSWKSLDGRSRRILVAMRQFDGSPTAEELQSTADISGDVFYSAAAVLVQRSLLSVVIRAQKTRYSLHPLTRYFINNDIAAKWARRSWGIPWLS